MSAEPERPAEAPAGPGEPGEHPLSVLLFSWMRTPLFLRVFAIGLCIAGVGLILAEIFLSPYAIKDVTGVPGFQGVFGFVAFAFAVLCGWPLGKWLRRPEDYYDRRSGEAGRDR